MTQYSRIHVFGKGAHATDIQRQNDRAARKTRWANQNPDKLLRPEELAAAIKELEKNPPRYKKRVRKSRNHRKLDTNAFYQGRGRKKRGKKKKNVST